MNLILPVAFIFAFLPVALSADSLTLPDAIKLAHEHSYSIKSSQFSLQAAEYDYLSTRAERFPTLSLNATGFYINKLQKVTALPVEMEIGSRENYLADFKLSVPLFTGGKLGGVIGAKRAIYKADLQATESVLMSVAYRSRLTWLNLSMMHRLVGSAEASLNRIIVIKENVNNLHDNGLADSLDLLEAELAYENVLEQLLKTRNDLNRISIALSILTGLDADQPIELSGTVPDPAETITDYRTFVISPEKIQRAELMEISGRIEAAENQIKVNRAAYFPNISGYAGYTYGKPNRDFFSSSWNDYFSAGLSLNWNFNFGGKTKNGVNYARGLSRMSRAAHSELEEKLVLDAKTALENILLAYDLYETSKNKYSITAGKFRLAEEKQKAGDLTINRLLEMESELTAAEQMFKASQINYFISETNFLYAIGSKKIYGGL